MTMVTLLAVLVWWVLIAGVVNPLMWDAIFREDWAHRSEDELVKAKALCMFMAITWPVSLPAMTVAGLFYSAHELLQQRRKS